MTSGARQLSRATLNEPSPEPPELVTTPGSGSNNPGAIQLEVAQRPTSPSRRSLSPTTLPPVSPTQPLVTPRPRPPTPPKRSVSPTKPQPVMVAVSPPTVPPPAATRPIVSPTAAAANSASERTSPQSSDYDNVNGSLVYEQSLDRTLESMENPSGQSGRDPGQAVSIITVNGTNQAKQNQQMMSRQVSSTSSVSYVRHGSGEVRKEVHMQESTVVQANGPFFPSPPSPTRQPTSPVRVSPSRHSAPPGHMSPVRDGMRSPVSPTRQGMTSPGRMSPSRHSVGSNPGHPLSPTRRSPHRSPTHPVNGSIVDQNGFPDYPLPPPPPSPPVEGSLSIRMSPSRSPPVGQIPHSASDGHVVDGLPLGSPTRTGVVHSRSTGGIVQHVTTPTEETRTVYRSSIYL